MNTLVKGLNIWHFLSFFVVISCSLDIGHESKFIFDLARTTETKKSIECLMDDWQNCPCSLVIESLAGNSCWFLNKNIPHIFFFFFAEYFPYFRINLSPLLLLISWFYYSNEIGWLQVVCFYFRSVQRSIYLLLYVLAIYSHLTTTHVSMLFIFQISVWSQQKIGFNLQIHASVLNITVM